MHGPLWSFLISRSLWMYVGIIRTARAQTLITITMTITIMIMIIKRNIETWRNDFSKIGEVR